MSPKIIALALAVFSLRIPMRGYEALRPYTLVEAAKLRIPMRGYELILAFLGLLVGFGYESPCGVMRANDRA